MPIVIVRERLVDIGMEGTVELRSVPEDGCFEGPSSLGFCCWPPEAFRVVGVISLWRIAVSSRVVSQLSKQKSRYAEFGFNKSKNKGNRKVSVGIRGYVDRCSWALRNPNSLGRKGLFTNFSLAAAEDIFLVALVVD